MPRLPASIHLQVQPIGCNRLDAGLPTLIDPGAIRESLAAYERQQESRADLAGKIAAGLDCANWNFQTRRGIIEILRAEVTLYAEEGTKLLRIKYIPEEQCCALCPALLEDLSDNTL
jgi:hypothetical protein